MDLISKKQPQAIEVEKSVLGVLLLEKDRLQEVKAILPAPECFYLDVHQKVYAAILRMSDRGAAVDIMTVVEELVKGGGIPDTNVPYFLTQLISGVVSGAHVTEWAEIILDKFIRRETIAAAGDMIKSAYDESVSTDEIRETFFTRLHDVYEERSSNNWVHISEVGREYLSERELRQNGGTASISTTLSEIDAKNGGFVPTQFVLIAARPSVGKSAFVLPIIVTEAKRHKAVGIVNLEMSNTQTFERTLAQETTTPFSDLNLCRNASEPYIIDEVGKLSGLPVYFTKSSSLNISDIVASIAYLKKKHGVTLVVIDYLQLVTPSAGKGNRESEVSHMSRQLKLTALNLGIVVIALSQLNRDSEKRGDKKPIMADLRESGSLEQDADVVMLLHRDFQAGILTDAQGNSTEYEADLGIAKWRNGRTGNFKLQFDGPTMKFSEPKNNNPF